VLVSALALPASALAVGSLSRESLGAGGAQANDGSYESQPIGNGRYVAFYSDATNLVLGDTNGKGDIFVRDRLTGAVERVSVSSTGAQAEGDSWDFGISADGRFISFVSSAENLVPDNNLVADAFVRDRVLGTTERVSVTSIEVQANGATNQADMTPDGRYVAMQSRAGNLGSGDSNGKHDIFVRDRLLGTTLSASPAFGGGDSNDYSERPSISADGRFVAFDSPASNLVAGDVNANFDAFVRDTVAGTTTRVSQSTAGVGGTAGAFAPTISDDGRFVVFAAFAPNLVAGDTNGVNDIFVRDRTLGTTALVNTVAGGMANGRSDFAVISPDGLLVAYESDASNLVPGDTNGVGDVFVTTRSTGQTQRMSVATNGTQANADCDEAAFGPDGRTVGFGSAATNLVAGDTNGKRDVFVATRSISSPRLVRSPSGSSKIYKRKKRVAKYTLAATLTDEIGVPVAGATVYLQKYNTKKKRWKTYKTFTTSDRGTVSMAFRSRSRSTTYYRWNSPATADRAAISTRKQKVRVK
jgi:hypothetical protein